MLMSIKKLLSKESRVFSLKQFFYLSQKNYDNTRFGSLGYERLQDHAIGNVPSEEASQVA
jgi:hypothetical protein